MEPNPNVTVNSQEGSEFEEDEGETPFTTWVKREKEAELLKEIRMKLSRKPEEA